MPKKTERGNFWDFSTSILSENMIKLKGDPSVKNDFRKKVSQSRKYSKGHPLVPLSFLDDVKILLRKLSKNCKKLRI